MSKQASKSIIGAFVIGGIALAVAGVLVFGTGNVFKNQYNFVLFFKGSVKGLNIGAPVMFRGVKVGSVTDILLRFNPDDQSIRIPVTVEVNPESFLLNEEAGEMKYDKYYETLIQKGLRGQLQLQSVLTGLLMVNLDLLPEKPPRFVGRKSRYLEIPTIASSFDELTAKLEKLPLDELFNKLVSSLEGIEKIINSPDVIGSFISLNQALKDAQQLMRNVDSKVESLALNINDASHAASIAFKQVEKTMAMDDGVSGELASELKETLSSARSALEESKQALSSVQDITAEDSSLFFELKNTLKEMSSAARSIRFLSDYLERHPESLLRGKGSSKGE